MGLLVAAKRFKYPLVVVLWEDAHSESSWIEMEEIKTSCTLVTSAGFLIRDTPESLVFTLGYSEDSIVDRMTIPRGMVKSITTIREPA